MTDPLSTSSIHLLVVDDEASVRESLEQWFLEDGYSVHTAENAAAALDILQRERIDLVLLDIKMPGMDGLALQERIREFDTDIIIIIITAFASVDTAVRALKAGAFDYVTKPIDPDELSTMVRNAAQQRRLARENAQLRQTVDALHHIDDIVGASEEMVKVFDLVRTVAPTKSTVLIRGESGTGKELIARAIHANSTRKYFPIIPVNCGALSESLLESELFGHEKGSFTGAQYRRKGKFEMANGGTLFLDEIGTLAPKTQVDLLRVLESHQFQRVGGEQTIHVDFRLICATNADLEAAVRDGTFREDLYYRINVFAITIPPLRERRGDIPMLAEHFVHKYARLMNRTAKEFSEGAMSLLTTYAWPGNVRELENAVERAMVVSSRPFIEEEDLPMHLSTRAAGAAGESLADVERRHIVQVLSEMNWNITRSAERLAIDRVTLYNKIEKYGLKRPE
ncbi:MAG: sigma-54-dependent Fis family transcriptional regulator [Ignavibacteriae bacterium]|nr:sigma-54-dependent Fis family transcriptional regulator [Ignavibacteriota bacterium]